MQQALSVIVGIVGTIALSGTLSYTEEVTAFSNSSVAFVLGMFAVCTLHYVYKHVNFSDKRGKVCSILYSFGLAFALTAGKQLHTVENFAVGNAVLWLQILVLTIFFAGYVLYGLQWLAGWSDSNDKGEMGAKEETDDSKDKMGRFVSGIGNEKTDKTKGLLITWLIIFLCWLPVFLAFYPGAFVYDAQDEYVQVATRTFTTHHPLSHVLMLGGFVCLGNKLFGSYNVGIAMYAIFQMIILSGIFAYTVSCLRTKLSKRACAVITLFYGFFPVSPMYAVCSAKDTLFSGMFLLMLLQMVKLSECLGDNKEKRVASSKKDNSLENALDAKNNTFAECGSYKADAAIFVLASAVMMLLRNNGVYVYLVLAVIVLVIALIKSTQRKCFLRFVTLMAVAFLLYVGVDKTLTVVLNADDSENQELLTVPIQQLARTYKYSPEVFSGEEKEILFSYIPEDVLKIYDADLSDLVKANFNNQRYAEHSSEFVGLWLDKFIEKPITYLNAWLMTSYGYWYPDTIINVYGGQQRFTFQYEESSYFGFETEQPGERDSKFPWLEEQYRKMSLEIYQQKVPVISMLFSPGFLFWMFMGCILFCFYQKKYQWLLPLGSVFLLWGTVILGPTVLVRYVLVLWFALPVWYMMVREGIYRAGV